MTETIVWDGCSCCSHPVLSASKSQQRLVYKSRLQLSPKMTKNNRVWWLYLVQPTIPVFYTDKSRTQLTPNMSETTGCDVCPCCSQACKISLIVHNDFVVLVNIVMGHFIRPTQGCQTSSLVRWTNCFLYAVLSFFLLQCYYIFYPDILEKTKFAKWLNILHKTLHVADRL